MKHCLSDHSLMQQFTNCYCRQAVVMLTTASATVTGQAVVKLTTELLLLEKQLTTELLLLDKQLRKQV